MTRIRLSCGMTGLLAMTLSAWIPTAGAADRFFTAANWTRYEALEQIDRQAAAAETYKLLDMARNGQTEALVDEIRTLQSGLGTLQPNSGDPQREYILLQLARLLGDLQPGRVEEAVLKLLSEHRSVTRVPGDEHLQAVVPLFDVAAAARGSQNNWSRKTARTRSENLLTQSVSTWLDAYQASDPVQRRGFLDALDTAPAKPKEALANELFSADLGRESIALAAARLALQLDRPVRIHQLLLDGHPAALPGLLRSLARTWEEKERLQLMDWAAQHASAETASLAVAMLAPAKTAGTAAKRAVLDESSKMANERIVQWVENAPASDSNVIALGYPVPMPVDTPQPFAGFRSYSGLDERHQQLADQTPWVHPHMVGTTHQGRSIMAYQLGDADRTTRFGQSEPAMLSNGGIHAREWQSPEVTTGIIELLAETDNDPLIQYLRDNANILVIPVLNIDGFLQTQRYPDLNWLGSDVTSPDDWPRDGRMRRKNMRGADTLLDTVNDHLEGVDLNRNNAPYWATSTRSSNDPASLVHHGSRAASEPEIQALDAAAQLGPAEKLSMYTDLHSFSQVHFWVRNTNQRLTTQTQLLLGTFSQFHSAFPAGKWYSYNTGGTVPTNRGIGSTDEFFTHRYQVPAWTLEIEPRGNAGQAGVDYGGLGRNGHDGFILPEAEVPRVRTELAQTFAVAYYRQAGPPSLSEFRIYDDATGAMVFQGAWDPADKQRRTLFQHQVQNLQADRDYTLWLAWDKPMRWRTDGDVAQLPGTANSLDLDITLSPESAGASLEQGTPEWLGVPGAAPSGYSRYRDDAVSLPLRLSLGEATQITLGVRTRDMTGHLTDAMPDTVARWENGGWAGYENDDGEDGNDTGGSDFNISFQADASNPGDPFVVETGLSSAWFDPERNGEGFIMEIISPDTALMYWFTYDSEGRQNWYTSTGEIRGNRAIFPELINTRGGQFGPDFDPAQVERRVVGRASFTWASCATGIMDWTIDQDGESYKTGRMSLVRITRVLGAACGQPQTSPQADSSSGQVLSGSWFDPDHDGEGYTLQMLDNGQALVYWFSYNSTGQPRWFFGLGDVTDGIAKFDEMYSTAGVRFGADFNPDDLIVSPWGSLELQLDCNGGSAVFAPVEEGFPAGSLELVQLTRLNGFECNP